MLTESQMEILYQRLRHIPPADNEEKDKPRNRAGWQVGKVLGYPSDSIEKSFGKYEPIIRDRLAF